MLGSHSTSLDENTMNEFNETAIVDDVVNANPKVDHLNSITATKISIAAATHCSQLQSNYVYYI